MPSTVNDPPPEVIDKITRLTRLARDAVDDNEANAYLRKRDRILAEYDYTARIRSEPTRDVLVCYPTEWVEDGTVKTEQIEDLSRGIERPLDGTGDEASFEAVDAANRSLVDRVKARTGRVHARNAGAFADFMGNHYVRRIESATSAEVREFLEEYYPRNVWPTTEERVVVEESLRLVFQTAGRPVPSVLTEAEE